MQLSFTSNLPGVPSRNALKSTVSWLSLVAATTAGLGSSSMVRARVRTASACNDKDELRLVVHSYLPGQLRDNGEPCAAEKPVASVQRAVTAAELRRGVTVDLLQPATEQVRPVLVAWVEQGRPNLEFDARLARPRAGVLRGSARTRRTVDTLCASLLLHGNEREHA